MYFFAMAKVKRDVANAIKMMLAIFFISDNFLGHKNRISHNAFS
jgi:hypothetical protein